MEVFRAHKVGGSQNGENTNNMIVSIQSFSFDPGTITVMAGSKVTWVNNDTVSHSVKSDTFNSPDMAPGDTFSFTFDNKGTYSYSCGVHPFMKGTVVVQ